MDIGTLFIITALSLFLIFFIPTAFTRCYCCGKIKLWFAFKKKAYNTNRSDKPICKKCCTYYEIESITELRQINKIRMKVEAELYDEQRKHLRNRE